MSSPGPSLGVSGWLRILPEPAAYAYNVIWFVRYQTGEPLRGDLDDPTSVWVELMGRHQELDEPYDVAAEEGEPELIEIYSRRWEQWKGYAAARGRPMESQKDAIEFMLELELIERREDEEGVYWTLPDRLPFPEEILPLSRELQEELAMMRWRLSFKEAQDAITSWLSEKRVPGAATGQIKTSLKALAAETGLDLEDARHGLSTLINEDIRCDADPETVAADSHFKITIDWQLFEELRTVYRAASPDDQQ